MEKLFIKNRRNQRIAVTVERAEPQKGLVFVMHGLGGFKEQPHIRAMADAFRAVGFMAVLFDAADSIGESGGRMEDATTASYYGDLEDVISWAAGQPWYREPFALTGHSLGGICTALYAQSHPEKISALAPISTVVSGQRTVDAHLRKEPEKFEAWQKTGWKEDASRSKPGVIKRLPWSHVEERLQYDLLPRADRLTMPVFLVVGENDDSTPPSDIRALYDALPGPREFHVIKGAPHSFKETAHLGELQQVMSRWVTSLCGSV